MGFIALFWRTCRNLLEKKLHFALVCIQISFPRVYNLLSHEPNFKSWDERLAQKLKLPTLSSDEVSRLNELDEFDETWEQVLYRFCQQETYLSQNAFNISNLLNLIGENIDDDEILGDTITKMHKYSTTQSLSCLGSLMLVKRTVDMTKWHVRQTPQSHHESAGTLG